MGCKIAQNKEEGVQNCTIDKKIGEKVQLNIKIGCKIRKRAKRSGAKSLQKKKVQNHTINKR